MIASVFFFFFFSFFFGSDGVQVEKGGEKKHPRSLGRCFFSLPMLCVVTGMIRPKAIEEEERRR